MGPEKLSTLAVPRVDSGDDDPRRAGQMVALAGKRSSNCLQRRETTLRIRWPV